MQLYNHAQFLKKFANNFSGFQKNKSLEMICKIQHIDKKT